MTAVIPSVSSRLLAGCRGFAVALTLLWGAGAGAVELSASHANPPGEATFEGMKRFADLLAASPAGVRMRLFPRGQLGEEKDIIEQVRLGAITLGAVAAANLSAFAPSVGVLDIPFLMRDNDRHPWAVVDGVVGQRIADAIERESGLVVLGWWSGGMRHVFTRSRPVARPSDLSELKIRVIGSPVYMDTFNGLGAKATPMPYGEVYTALATGTVDGAENDTTGYRNMKFFEQAPELSLTGHFFLFKPVVANRMALARLTAEQRRTFDAAFAEATRFQRTYSSSKFDSDIAWLTTEGHVRVTKPDRAALEAAVRPVQEKYARRYGRELVEAIRNTR